MKRSQLTVVLILAALMIAMTALPAHADYLPEMPGCPAPIPWWEVCPPKVYTRTRVVTRTVETMIESIDAPGPVMDFGTALGKDIYPTGKDRKGVRNAEKAFILHYGRNGWQRIAATYWVDDADAISEARVPPRLDALWQEFMDTGKVPSLPASGGSAGGITKKTE